MRLEDGSFLPVLSDSSRVFAKSCLDESDRPVIDALRPTLWVNYTRVTLVHPVNRERLTIDVNLRYSDDRGCRSCDHLVIAELKHSNLLAKSGFFNILKRLNIHPATFSKYCMGMVLMEKHTKTNRFKRQVRLIEKLS